MGEFRGISGGGGRGYMESGIYLKRERGCQGSILAQVIL